MVGIVKENKPMLLEEGDKLNKTQACTAKADIWTCKKNDGKRWRCSSTVDRLITLCEYHLGNSRSYYTLSKKGASATASMTNSKLTIKALTDGSKTTLMKASSSKPKAAGAPSSSKAAPAAQPAKRTSTNGSSGGENYFYDFFGPFRRKDRTNCSNLRVSDSAEDKRQVLTSWKQQTK
uniref:WRC domain-containing protein n=1 Tax=Leersia perrieri TaxID=77586 RepID=A0A0D9VG21_9ORYZ